MNDVSTSLAVLTPRGTIRVVPPAWIPIDLDEATKAIPGRSYRDGGWEWGFSDEVLVKLKALVGLSAEAEAAWVRSLNIPIPDPHQRTPVRPLPVGLAWRAQTPGREHQREFKWWRRGGGLDSRSHRTCLLEAGLGTGKTLMAIEEILELLERQVDPMILVLARNSTLRTVWGEQLDQHAPHLPWRLLNGPRQRRLGLLQRRKPGVVHVHNHEDLPAMGKALALLPWDMIIVDETARFRTATARRTGRLTGYRARVLDAPFKLGLSGEPVIKGVLDLYPILRWLGAPTGTKEQFAERFVEVDEYKREVAIKDLDGLLRLLATVRFSIPKGTVFNLPRAWHYERVELRPWQRAAYRRIQKDLKTQFIGPDGKVQEALVRNRLTEMLRLTQVTAGFEAIDSERFTWRDDNAKTEHLLNNVLPALRGEPVIVWAHFHPEIESIARLAAEAGWKPVMFYGDHPGSQTRIDAANDAAFAAFTSGQADLFVANMAKGAHGLNLPHAHTMVYYTRTPDTESWTQSLERNARLTSDGTVLNVVVLEAEDTWDQNTTRILGDDLRRAAQVTAADVAYALGLE